MNFEIPVVLFFYKRISGIRKILAVLETVKPSVLYIFSDGGKTDADSKEISLFREEIKEMIRWDCDLHLIFQKENVGVYKQIGLGALQVFEKEDKAIFLEDDNLPEISFFEYCREMLYRYENNDRVLWVCGTNYLGDYSDEQDYYFTQSLLPCGWASWSKKFTKYYDKNLDSTKLANFKKVFLKKYICKPLGRQQYRSIMSEVESYSKTGKYRSWDYHMILSIKMNNMFGIVPAKNQIKNIGVDNLSTHSKGQRALFNNIMTQRFCGMESYPLHSFRENLNINLDKKLERKLNHTILAPLPLRIIGTFIRFKNKLIKKK